ncbi:MAG TPA: hypothetical protein ENI98_09760 [Gammaproteobacteria bacterium]|nr:hypothetical protein [Gammaproteobacteria bacterium]
MGLKNHAYGFSQRYYRSQKAENCRRVAMCDVSGPGYAPVNPDMPVSLLFSCGQWHYRPDTEWSAPVHDIKSMIFLDQ